MFAIASSSCTQTPNSAVEPLPDVPVAVKESASPAQPVEPAAEATNANPLYTVTRIYDGDTVETFKDGQTIKVRLACIDAPESDQAPHGQASEEKLSSLVGGQVRLNVVDQDRYGRSVAEVYSPSGSFINLQMVESGDAVVYTQYLSSCGPNGDRLLRAEQQAEAAKRGVWADANFVMPWDYRHGGGAAAPQPTASVAPSPQTESSPPSTGLPACVSSDCDCGDFSSWQQAQDVLESSSGDPHSLDGDGDGVACESLQ